MNKFQKALQLGELPSRLKKSPANYMAEHNVRHREESQNEHRAKMEAFDRGEEPIKRKHPDKYREEKVQPTDKTRVGNILKFIETQHHMGEGNMTLNEYKYLYK